MLNILRKIYRKIKEIHGKTIKRFSLLGFPIFSLTQVNVEHYNLFVCLIPLLRINKHTNKAKGYSFEILILVWLYKFILLLFSGIKKRRQKKQFIENAPIRFGKPLYHEKLQRKLQRGKKLVVVLFESRISCWQYDELYQILKESPYFTPVVVLKPFAFQGKETMIREMENAFTILKKRGIHVVKGYDQKTGKYLDVRRKIKPDAVFYSMYWKPHFAEGFYIDHYKDIYSFLFAYGFDVASHPDHESMNFELQNAVTRYYLPTPLHRVIAEANMDNYGANTFVTGSPKLDLLIDKNYTPSDVWKPQAKQKKRIIWAPHHSDGFNKAFYQFNAFYEIYDYMLKLAEKYKDEVQFAFKPHPMLKPKLDEKWGIAAADAYYQKWADYENCQLETGEFKDLFIGSDAMILDSISFIAEYTITNKPAFFTIGKTTRVMMNTYGEENFKVLYKTVSDLKTDIEKFIVDVVINGNDVKKAERTAFIEKYMLPPNGVSASQNIYNDMVDIIINGNYDTSGGIKK